MKKSIKTVIIILLTIFLIIINQYYIYAAGLKFKYEVGSGARTDAGGESSPAQVYEKYYDESTGMWDFEGVSNSKLQELLDNMQKSALWDPTANNGKGGINTWGSQANADIRNALIYAIGVSSGKYSEEGLLNLNSEEILNYTNTYEDLNITTKIADTWYNKVKTDEGQGLYKMGDASKKISDDIKKKFNIQEIAWYIGYGKGNGYSPNGSATAKGPGVDTVSESVKEEWIQTVIESNNEQYQGILEILDPDTDIKLGVGELYVQPDRKGDKGNSEESLEDMISDADSFVKEGELKYNDTALQNFSKTFYNIMLTIGVFAAVIVGGILGIRIMLASASERADAKKMLVPYAVGCFIIFGGFGIWKLVLTILEGI